jgi:hypothetical protein
MPRIYDSHGDPHDLCMTHFPKTEAQAEKKYRDLSFENSEEGKRHEARGNGGWGYDSGHPCYEDEIYEEDGRMQSDYRCEVCNRVLRERDEGTV